MTKHFKRAPFTTVEEFDCIRYTMLKFKVILNSFYNMILVTVIVVATKTWAFPSTSTLPAYQVDELDLIYKLDVCQNKRS